MGAGIAIDPPGSVRCSPVCRGVTSLASCSGYCVRVAATQHQRQAFDCQPDLQQQGDRADEQARDVAAVVEAAKGVGQSPGCEYKNDERWQQGDDIIAALLLEPVADDDQCWPSSPRWVSPSITVPAKEATKTPMRTTPISLGRPMVAIILAEPSTKAPTLEPMPLEAIHEP